MRGFKKWITTLGAAVCAFALVAAPVYADTDGTEMKVAAASQLEIQLGTAWSGVEFQLRTDVGMYPDTIAVGEDGVLRLEIGGSSTYTLTCLNSTVAAPLNGEAASAEVSRSDTDITTQEQQDASQNTPTESNPVSEPDKSESEIPGEEPDGGDDETATTIAGIPIMHIALFGGGLLLAIGGLVAIRVINRHREDRVDYDDDDDDA